MCRIGHKIDFNMFGLRDFFLRDRLLYQSKRALSDLLFTDE